MTKTEKNPAETVPDEEVAEDEAGDTFVFAEFLSMIPDNREFVFRFLEMFPIPVEVFGPDGTTVFINRALMELHGITDPGLAVGVYNVLNDPVMDQMGIGEGIRQVFNGEAFVAYDVDAPVQDILDRGIINEKPFEKSFSDFHLYPIMNGSELAFVVFVMNVKKLYHGRPDLARAKEYLDSRWQEEYNAEALAKAVNMSVTQIYKLFKKYVGMTPGDYCKKCKIEHIKEKLKDTNLSVKEAFAACGEDSQGTYARIFKKATGLSPTLYRSKN